MKILRPLLTLLVVIIVAAIAFIWWSVPAQVDLTEYAPADSVVYIEVNSLPRIAEGLSSSPAWTQAYEALRGKPAAKRDDVGQFVARAGLAPAAAVVLTRTQIALVVLNMNTTEEQNSLRVKPEFALIAETHTWNWRIKGLAKEWVQKLATATYGTANCAERNANGTVLFECGGSTPERKIVAAIEGSLIVVGNTEKAVQTCLEVRHGARPSLKTNGEVQEARAANAMYARTAFGYVPKAHTARLFAWAAPLFLGAAASDTNLAKLLEGSLSKLIGGISWTSNYEYGEVQDRFVFGLEPDVIAQLRPIFVTQDLQPEALARIPSSVDSVSLYRSAKPITAWDALNTAVALKLDAVQAVVIGTVLRSALTSYGLSNPRNFLEAIESPVFTLKTDETAEGSVLLTRVGSQERLKSYLNSADFAEGKGQIIGLKNPPRTGAEFTALLQDGWLVVGRSENVNAYQQALRQGTWKADDLTARKFIGNSAGIITASQDEERVLSFIRTLLRFDNYQMKPEDSAKLKEIVRTTARSATTETNLTDKGLERVTYSPFGQFSTLTSVFDDGGK